jgi:hypothetical protein
VTYYEDLLVGSGTPTSLKGMSGVEFVTTDNSDPWAGFLLEGPFRGENDIIDGMPGEVGALLVRDAYEFSIGPFTISGADRPTFLANLAGVRGLFAGQNVLLTRRLTAALTPFYTDDSCNGQYLGLSIVGTPTPTEVDVVLNLRNLDGEWS